MLQLKRYRRTSAVGNVFVYRFEKSKLEIRICDIALERKKIQSQAICLSFYEFSNKRYSSRLSIFKDLSKLKNMMLLYKVTKNKVSLST